MATIKIGDRPYPRPYWPQELTEEGYRGDLKIYTGVSVIVIPKPGARDRDVAKSLQILAEEFKHKAEIEDRSP